MGNAELGALTAPPAGLPDKHRVRASFGAAAASYDGVAQLQRTIGSELIDRARALAFTPSTIVDIGTGTGYCADELRAVFPESRLVGVDLAEDMLKTALARPNFAVGAWPVCGDAEALPLAGGCIDLVISNLALQWCCNLAGVFAEFARVLRPGGVVLFSSFGPATLRELRQAWWQVDELSHVNEFRSVTEVEQLLKAAGLEDVRLGSRRLVVRYPDVYALMRELKGMGAHNVTANRPRQLTGKGHMRAMVAAYERAMGGGGIRASFDVLIGVARAV